MDKVLDELGKVLCRECGKYFDFLAPHVLRAHQMSLANYRERWNIPKQQALASISHRSNCRTNIMARIQRGEICPTEQVEMMRKAYNSVQRKPTSSPLHKVRASDVARKYQIWKASPVIRPAKPAIKKEAIKRMKARNFSQERVKDIADDLNLSISRLYAWLRKS